MLPLFRRGVADGTPRADLPAEALLATYGDLIGAAITRAASNRAGVEQTSAAVLTVFLNALSVTSPRSGPAPAGARDTAHGS